MSTAMPVLSTERLVVRPFTMDDLDELNRVLNAAWDEAVPRDERERWLRWTVAAYEGLASVMQPPYGDRAVVLPATGELVGMVGLVPSYGPFGRLPSFGGNVAENLMRPELGLYWAIAPWHQGKGFAPEAARAIIEHVFSALNAHAIVATTEYENARSIAVMRKLGMSIERNPRDEPAWSQIVGVLKNPATNAG